MSDRCKIMVGDSMELLRTLPAESVHCTICSPPYLNLRNYQIPPTLWSDGRLDCLGLEPTPEIYVAHMVEFFREVRRVMRNDATLWVNLGDSYAGVGKSGGGSQGEKWESEGAKIIGSRGGKWQKPPDGLACGNMLGIPWRVALALQADGWILRRDIIWEKPSCMPESISGWRWERCRIKTKAQEVGSQASVGNSKRTRDMRQGQYLGSAEYIDCPGCSKCEPNGGLILRKGSWRPTTSHEYVFQFAKSADYFCDGEAGKEKTTGGAHARGLGVNPKAKMPGKNSRIHQNRDPAHGESRKQNPSFSAAVCGLVSTRNKRSVWKIATAPFNGAHFATFPIALVKPIIAIATPAHCCASCGAPWAPVVERGSARAAQQKACGGDKNGEYHGTAQKDFEMNGVQNASAVKARILAGMVEKKITGHRPTCKCAAGSVPATVLDPFGGAGSTAVAALQLGRRAIIMEINPEYAEMARGRTDFTHGLPL